MPLWFIKEDISKIKADIVVNPTDEDLTISTNVSKAILSAAGPELEKAISEIKYNNVGCIVSTPAFNSSYRYIFHASIPDWYGGKKNDRDLLESCYSEALYSAEESSCNSIVFPLLGVGLFGFPLSEAVKAAVNSVTSYLSVQDKLTVIIAVPDTLVFNDLEKMYPDSCLSSKDDLSDFIQNSLDDKLKHKEKTFYDLLTSYIERSKMTSVQCYTAAGIDKKLYSKIKTAPGKYYPSKENILKFALALRLNITETQKLLSTCGYILSDSIPQDIIYKHYISQQIYDYKLIQNKINESRF